MNKDWEVIPNNKNTRKYKNILVTPGPAEQRSEFQNIISTLKLLFASCNECITGRCHNIHI